MRKICSKCGTLLEDATQEDRICPQCGGALNSLSAEDKRDITPRRPMSVDNRIHKGDNIGAIHNGNEMHVAGDNAENIDKSTSITTNNTTNTTTNNTSNVTNIIQAKDEGMELVRCEMSGRNVRKIETFQCNVCHRTIYQAFFSNDFKCCEECAQKKRQALQSTEYNRRINDERQRQIAEQQRQERERLDRQRQEQLEQQRRLSMQANKPEPQRPSTSGSTSYSQPSYHGTAGRETEQKTSSHKFLWTVVFLLVVGGGYYLWAGRSNSERVTTNVEQQEAPAEEEAASTPTETPTTSKTARNNTPSSTASASSNAPSPTPSASEEAPKAETASSPWAEGEKAYKNGEYSKAKVYLQQAADGGKAMANYYLAQMYESGKGVSPDLRKAFSYMKKAAEGGCTKAYFPLAEMLRNGDGTEANRAQAKKWYERTVTSDRAHADMAAEILETYE